MRARGERGFAAGHAARLLVAVAAAVPANGLAQAIPATSCQAVCVAPASEPLPECPTTASQCQQALAAGLKSRAYCSVAGGTMENCCPADCALRAAPTAPDHQSTRSWWLFDAVLGPVVRHVPGDTRVQLVSGVIVEWLLGPGSWNGDRLPLRAGPFVSATANFDRKKPTGVQLTGGLTVMLGGVGVWQWLVSGGALLDLREESANRAGGLARVSVGGTTTGRRSWKVFSTWLYLEAHWIPGGDRDTRQEILLGLRVGPLLGLMFFGGSPDS